MTKDRKTHSEWVTFLQIPEEKTRDIACALDPGWMAARGIQSASPLVLRLLKDRILPLIRYLEKHAGLERYHFLVHDRASGVPTTEDDHHAYLHLRLWFRRGVDLVAKLSHARRVEGWTFADMVLTRPVKGERDAGIGGLDMNLLRAQLPGEKGPVRGQVPRAWSLIDAQSRWVLELLEAHHFTDDGTMVMQVRQYLHYFANMLQMQVA